MKQDKIADLIRKTGGQLGLDDEASSVIIRNLDATTMPMCLGSPFTDDEQDTDEFKIIFFVLDKSGSMEEVEAVLIEEFNQTVIPGLLEGAKNVVAGIRVGGLAFDSRITPLWSAGFKPIAELPPLTTKDYKTANGSTALFRAVLDAFTAISAYALDIRGKTGSNPEITVVVISDGANNQLPADPDEVYQIASKFSPELVTLAFAGFETFENKDYNVDFGQVARDMGFREIFEMKARPGETLEDRRRRFRHFLRIMSNSVIGHVSKTKVTTAAGGFWDE